MSVHTRSVSNSVAMTFDATIRDESVSQKKSTKDSKGSDGLFPATLRTSSVALPDIDSMFSPLEQPLALGDTKPRESSHESIIDSR